MVSEPTAPKHDRNGERAALLIVDMINCFDFPGGEILRARAHQIVEPILRLRRSAEETGSPVIYVNDNFGEWHSERTRLLKRAASSDAKLARRIAPKEDDYFIIKPQFSGFYATNLPVLLPKLGVRRLILTGVATDICILFTAADAHMRDYDLWIPSDAVAAECETRGRWALEIMGNSMGAQTAPTSECSLSQWSFPSARR